MRIRIRRRHVDPDELLTQVDQTTATLGDLFDESEATRRLLEQNLDALHEVLVEVRAIRVGLVGEDGDR